MELQLAIQVYFSATETFKDIFRYFFFCEKKVRKGDWQEVYPSISRIARAVGCSTRTIKRFNKSTNGYPMNISERKNDGGGDETNLYKMDDDFFKAMHWMDSKNLLYAQEWRVPEILKQAKYIDQKEALSPPPLSYGCHPSLTLSQTQIQYTYVHPLIEKIGIPAHQKKILSKNPEFAIVNAIEDARWYRWKLGKEIKNPYAFLKAQIDRHTGRRLWKNPK